MSSLNNKRLSTSFPTKKPDTQFEDLRDALAYAHNIIDTIHDALLVLDEKLCVQEANRSFYEIFQVTEDDTVGHVIFDLGNGQWDNVQLRELLDRVMLADYEVRKFLITHTFPHVGKRTMRLNVRRFKGHNDRFQILLAIQDVTDQHRATLALKHHVAKLTRSNDDLEQFAFLASHDLQSPLQTIISYLQLLSERYGDGQLGPDADDFIQFTIESAAHLQHMTRDLLRYAQINERPPDFKRVDLQVVLDAALGNLLPLIQNGGAIVVNDPLPVVYGDEAQLVRVFQNLIENAIKFRNEKPPKIYVRAEELETAWQVSIQDNGIGIERDHWESIFELFQRVYGRAEFAGSGIGLAIVKSVIELHGGRVWVESIPHQSATFFFTIAKETGSKSSNE